MKNERYLAIMYNNSGTCAYLPIAAPTLKKAERLAESLAEQMEPQSGGTQFVADVKTLEDFEQVIRNARDEKRPYTATDNLIQSKHDN